MITSNRTNQAVQADQAHISSAATNHKVRDKNDNNNYLSNDIDETVATTIEEKKKQDRFVFSWLTPRYLSSYFLLLVANKPDTIFDQMHHVMYKIHFEKSQHLLQILPTNIIEYAEQSNIQTALESITKCTIRAAAVKNQTDDAGIVHRLQMLLKIEKLSKPSVKRQKVQEFVDAHPLLCTVDDVIYWIFTGLFLSSSLFPTVSLEKITTTSTNASTTSTSTTSTNNTYTNTTTTTTTTTDSIHTDIPAATDLVLKKSKKHVLFEHQCVHPDDHHAYPIVFINEPSVQALLFPKKGKCILL
jgi:hypothetical protein